MRITEISESKPFQNLKFFMGAEKQIEDLQQSMREVDWHNDPEAWVEFEGLSEDIQSVFYEVKDMVEKVPAYRKLSIVQKLADLAQDEYNITI